MTAGDPDRRPRRHRPAAPLDDHAHARAWPAARSPPCRWSPWSARMIKKPGTQLDHTPVPPNPSCSPNGGRRSSTPTGSRVSPDDMQPGGIATVFPGVRQAATATTASPATRPPCSSGCGPARPSRPARARPSFGWPANGVRRLLQDLHARRLPGLAVRAADQSRLLCPCHQSQFEVLEDAKPVFGPATRSLPKLPLGRRDRCDGTQYFVAKADFPEPIGPGFWERP